VSGQPVLIVAGPGAGKVHVANDADVAALARASGCVVGA